MGGYDGRVDGVIFERFGCYCVQYGTGLCVYDRYVVVEVDEVNFVIGD